MQVRWIQFSVNSYFGGNASCFKGFLPGRLLQSRSILITLNLASEVFTSVNTPHVCQEQTLSASGMLVAFFPTFAFSRQLQNGDG